ncbi:hypothetical protein [Caballeronia sordidicola]|uniref:Uncharacterized protein n=1 Tax=Caballeronia sordidicola TaxID=196367 RepID=A0A242MST6_CABSO|nr:hypothetical protein [Caballeronia sordidicola]OTP74446.1 hypothetical protein PAMC26510_16530 [Caballeronia sordidicola]
MRYYRININDPKTGQLLVPDPQGKRGFLRVDPDPSKSTFSSLNKGANVRTLGGTNPSALRVQLDIPNAFLHTPQSGAVIRVSGISLDCVGQASNLTGMLVSIYGGMARGLPLANPNQAGLLARGQVFKSSGTWINVDTSLEIFLYSGGSSPSSSSTTGNTANGDTPVSPSTNDQPANIVFVWKRGQRLIDALSLCLQVAFPKYRIAGSISENLVWTSYQDCVGIYATLEQLAIFINERSLHILGGSDPNTSQYSGVCMVAQNNEITITDGSTITTPKVIEFNDLIGQPSWDKGLNVQALVVMRGDIFTGDFVTLPLGLGIITSNAPSQASIPGQQLFQTSGQQFTSGIGDQQDQRSIFRGTYFVSGVRHIGDRQDANGTAWCTVLSLDYYPPVPVRATPTLQTATSLPTIFTGNSAAGYFLPS